MKPSIKFLNIQFGIDSRVSSLLQNISTLPAFTNLTNVNDMVQVWNSLFLEIVNIYAPINQHRIKKSRQPDWLDPERLDTIKERKKCKINGCIEAYKRLRNKVFAMIKSAKQYIYKKN